MMDLAEMEVALVSFSKQLAILQSYLSLKFGLEFQEFYDRSQRILPGMGPVLSGHHEERRGDRGEQSRGCPNPQPPVPPSGPVESSQMMSGRNQELGNEEPHSTMEVDEGEEVADESCLKTEVEEGLSFVCVKNENEEEEVKIIPDIEDEDLLMFTPNVGLTGSEAEIDEEEIVEETRTTDLEDPLAIAIADYEKVGQSSHVDLRSSKGKGIQHHRKNSTDEEYQEEDANSSSEEDEDPIRATPVILIESKDGDPPVRRGRGRPPKDPKKVKEKKKAGRKRGRKPTINVHRTPPQPRMPVVVRPPNIKSVGNIKPLNRDDLCSYCTKSLTEEQILEHRGQSQKDEKEGGTSSRPVCNECAKVYQSTAEKIKNLWSSIIPSAQGKPSSKS